MPFVRPRKTPTLLAIGSIAVLLVALAAAWLLARQTTADAWVRHTLEVESRINHAQMLAARAEIYRRGYLLTGDADAVANQRKMESALRPDLARLGRLVADNPVQAHRADALRAVVSAKLDEQRRSIQLYAAGRRDEAVAILAQPASRAITFRLVGISDAMRASEQALLELRRARADRLRLLGTLTFGACALVLVALALLVANDRRRRLLALAAANRALEDDILARKALERELDAARLRAEAAKAAKSAFLADMSHEIRTPMNGVIGFTELLLGGELDAEQRRHAELIADSGRAMMRLLNDILDLSKIEAGQMRVVAETFDLPHTVRACAKLMAPAIGQRGLAFDQDLAPDLPRFVLGDGLRVRQILLNLLGNAAKFTSEGGIVLRARLSADAACIVIEVEDSGIGIAADRQQAVFDHFVQADDGIAPRFGGTGLGLAISAQLARLMGGDLTLDSEIGRGSLFTLAIPLRVPSAIAVDTPSAATAPEEPSPSTSPSLRVLVAEDHDVNRMLIQAMLDRLGHRADIAGDGGEAAALAIAAATGDDPYAVVLMDVQMPEVDGLEATRRIRAAGLDGARLPILALTANAYADDIAACLAAGMQAHLSKPLNGGGLDAAIRRWTARPAAPVARAGGADRFSPQLRERYAARRDELIRAIETLGGQQRVGDPAIAELGRMLHKFLGSAEMFGDAALAREARAIETGLAGWPRARRAEELARAAAAMRHAA